ncbi:LADA_0E11474g1_1 [Lachancea dasiensis]|uniref:Ubiquitin carboxyl-terminal hydrolase n=1 Tax=Lachancea dasiensis TaxID=1072105 RepID=A0A1G4JEM1_9SACH|nr:LADA_0E11474g1_1 [Lachancea dasiensis]
MSFVLEKLSALFSTWDSLIRNFNKSEHRNSTLLVLIASTTILLYKNRRQIRDIMENFGMVGGDLTRGFRNNYRSSMFNKWGSKNPALEEKMFERGGYVGGLVNDGNTCFMNSVLQSLASSQRLLQFLDEELIEANKELDNANPIEETVSAGANSQEPTDTLNTEKKPKGSKVYGKRKKRAARLAEKQAAEDDNGAVDITFSTTLKELVDTLNAQHHRDRPYYKTNKLLKTMSKAPNKSILLGYDQEDAQEFFQTILSELEKNVISLYGKASRADNAKVKASDLSEDAMVGQQKLGSMGTVFIPSDQIDPNSVLGNDPEQFYSPYPLVTPLDGITVERIGCLNCGENGGMRYSVFSGLSLNLPNENIGSNLKLSKLLNDWSKPEIIEGVECNRCSLKAVLEHLEKTLVGYEASETCSEKLVEAVRTRILELRDFLAKPVIDDNDYKNLHTDNMVKKTSKAKQILISRPPPLLCIHINRSVFDPRTYMIRKNNSRVLFKSKLNLAPWCCDIGDINLDARLPMSKNDQQTHDSSEDENVGGEYFAQLHRRYEEEFDDSDEEEDGNGYHRSGRDVSNYDPLKGEVDSSSGEENRDSEEEEDFEVDTLGNRVYKPKERTTHNDVVGNSDDEKGDVAHEPGHAGSPNEGSSDDEVESLEENQTDADRASAIAPVQQRPIPSASTVPAGPLTYALRSVIVHYGTHNYGHYIAFRKFRGLWWRISDETVYVVEEEEVLSTPGIFMMFYEYDYNEELDKMNDDLEWTEADEVPDHAES